MPTLDQAIAEYADSIILPPPQKGFLGTFVDGSFQTRVTTDPSLTWVRDERNQTTTAKHHGQINLDTGDNNIPIELYRDENGDLACRLDREQAGAIEEAYPGGTVPTHTHAASAITSGTLIHERGGLEADVSAYDGFVRISGGTTTFIKANLSASAAPGASDDSSAGYSIGSTWIDTSNDDIYMAVDVSVGAAVWLQLN